MTIERVLWSAAIAGVIVGTALRIVPGSTPDPAFAAVPPPAHPPAPAAVSTGSGIVAANIFAPDRTAPRLRFAPKGAVPAAAAPAAPVITLYGITLTAYDAFALIDADPRVRGAEIYRVGDLVQGARVMAISDSTVTLAARSGGGSRVLRLPPAPALRRSM